MQELVKIVVTVPVTHADDLREAIGKVGSLEKLKKSALKLIATEKI